MIDSRSDESSGRDCTEEQPTVAAARDLIRQRVARLAGPAMDVYATLLSKNSKPPRNATVQLAAARDIIQLIVGGELGERRTAPTPAPAANSPTQLEEFSEKLRLIKQAERRGQ
jgi:hypothetical protein